MFTFTAVKIISSLFLIVIIFKFSTIAFDKMIQILKKVK